MITLAERAASRAPVITRRPRRLSPTPYLFLAPGLIVFIVLIAYPMARVVQMSFYHWDLLHASRSTLLGFGNYTRALRDPVFWRACTNSGVYMAVTVPIQIALGLAVAVLLNARAPARSVFRVLYYLPVVTSWVIVSLLFKFLFADEGLINWLLVDTHLTAQPVSWLAGRWTALAAICALGIWKGIGWSMIIFLAALQSVPRVLEEAAAVDGANAWQRFRHVSLPAIRPALVFVTVMLVIGGLNVFASVLLMTGGGPNDATQVLLTFMYQEAFTNLDFGYGSAIAVLLTLAVFVVSLAQLRILRTDQEATP